MTWGEFAFSCPNVGDVGALKCLSDGLSIDAEVAFTGSVLTLRLTSSPLTTLCDSIATPSVPLGVCTSFPSVLTNACIYHQANATHGVPTEYTSPFCKGADTTGGSDPSQLWVLGLMILVVTVVAAGALVYALFSTIHMNRLEGRVAEEEEEETWQGSVHHSAMGWVEEGAFPSRSALRKPIESTKPMDAKHLPHLQIPVPQGQAGEESLPKMSILCKNHAQSLSGPSLNKIPAQYNAAALFVAKILGDQEKGAPRPIKELVVDTTGCAHITYAENSVKETKTKQNTPKPLSPIKAPPTPSPSPENVMSPESCVGDAMSPVASPLPDALSTAPLDPSPSPDVNAANESWDADAVSLSPPRRKHNEAPPAVFGVLPKFETPIASVKGSNNSTASTPVAGVNGSVNGSGVVATFNAPPSRKSSKASGRHSIASTPLAAGTPDATPQTTTPLPIVASSAGLPRLGSAHRQPSALNSTPVAAPSSRASVSSIPSRPQRLEIEGGGKEQEKEEPMELLALPSEASTPLAAVSRVGSEKSVGDALEYVTIASSLGGGGGGGGLLDEASMLDTTPESSASSPVATRSQKGRLASQLQQDRSAYHTKQGRGRGGDSFFAGFIGGGGGGRGKEQIERSEGRRDSAWSRGGSVKQPQSRSTSLSSGVGGGGAKSLVSVNSVLGGALPSELQSEGSSSSGVHNVLPSNFSSTQQSAMGGVRLEM